MYRGFDDLLDDDDTFLNGFGDLFESVWGYISWCWRAFSKFRHLFLMVLMTLLMFLVTSLAVKHFLTTFLTFHSSQSWKHVRHFWQSVWWYWRLFGRFRRCFLKTISTTFWGGESICDDFWRLLVKVLTMFPHASDDLLDGLDKSCDVSDDLRKTNTLTTFYKAFTLISIT